MALTLPYIFQNDGKMRLSMDVEKIIWPGNLVKKPTGLMIPTHLNVLTIAEKPFVYHRILNSSETCDADKGEILCPHYNTEPTGVQRCKSCFLSAMSLRRTSKD